MLTKTTKCSALVFVAALWLGGHVLAADSPQTVMTVETMSCNGCAKKRVVKVQAVAGLQKVEADVEEKTLTVTPKLQVVISPEALWEAVERGDDLPKTRTGPHGAFTSKPKS